MLACAGATIWEFARPMISVCGRDFTSNAPYRIEAWTLHLRWRNLVAAIRAEHKE
jgi:hypothetical protein